MADKKDDLTSIESLAEFEHIEEDHSQLSSLEEVGGEDPESPETEGLDNIQFDAETSEEPSDSPAPDDPTSDLEEEASEQEAEDLFDSSPADSSFENTVPDFKIATEEGKNSEHTQEYGFPQTDQFALTDHNKDQEPAKEMEVEGPDGIIDEKDLLGIEETSQTLETDNELQFDSPEERPEDERESLSFDDSEKDFQAFEETSENELEEEESLEADIDFENDQEKKQNLEPTPAAAPAEDVPKAPTPPSPTPQAASTSTPAPEPPTTPPTPTDTVTPLSKEQVQAKKISQEYNTFTSIAKEEEGVLPFKVEVGGNPPFSVIVDNIKNIEDGEHIFDLLKKYEVVTPSNEQLIRNSLNNGNILISQLSEFTAIMLVHKLRHLPVTFEFGLSEEVRPKATPLSGAKGLTHRASTSKRHSFNLDLQKQHLKSAQNIIAVTTDHIEGKQIISYISPLVQSLVLPKESFESAFTPDDLDSNMDEQSPLYQNLVSELKKKAYKLKANAIVGMKFNFNPLWTRASQLIHDKNTTNEQDAEKNREQNLSYSLTCIGNAVYVEDSNPIT